jgi:hypothetical protein
MRTYFILLFLVSLCVLGHLEEVPETELEKQDPSRDFAKPDGESEIELSVENEEEEPVNEIATENEADSTLVTLEGWPFCLLLRLKLRISYVRSPLKC